MSCPAERLQRWTIAQALAIAAGGRGARRHGPGLWMGMDVLCRALRSGVLRLACLGGLRTSSDEAFWATGVPFRCIGSSWG